MECHGSVTRLGILLLWILLNLPVYKSCLTACREKVCWDVSCEHIACPSLEALSNLFPVGDLDVSTKLNSTFEPEFRSRATVSIQWKLDEKEISGDSVSFVISIASFGKQNKECIHSIKFNPKSSEIQAEGSIIAFRYDSSLSPGDYEVRVGMRGSSATVGSSRVSQALLVIKQREQDELKSPAFWITDFAVQNNSCEKTISLTFELPPAIFEFQTISIVLMKMFEIDVGEEYWLDFVDSEYNIIGNETYARVKFNNVSNGIYSFKVRPFEINPLSNDCKCKCNDVENPNCRSQRCPSYGCKWSLMIISFEIVNVSPDDCVIRTPLNTWKLISIGAGCVVALLALSLIGWKLLWPRTAVLDWNTRPRVRVLVIYSKEDDQHSDVVHILVHFLEAQCHCDVMIDYNDREAIAQDSATYILHTLDRADKILLIDSDGICRGTDLERNMEHPGSSQIPSRDPLEYFTLPMLRGMRSRLQQDPTFANKLVLARFKYTGKTTTAHNLGFTKSGFVLMDHIEEVVLKLHGIPKYGRGRRNRILQATKRNYTKTVHGRQLSEALVSVNRPDPNSSSTETETRDFNSASEMERKSTEEQMAAFDRLSQYCPDKHDDEECRRMLALTLEPTFTRSRNPSGVEELEELVNQGGFKFPDSGVEETYDSGYVRSISFPSIPPSEFGNLTFIPPSITGSGSIHSSDLDFHVTSFNDDFDRENSLQ